jgi:hypothetical protein
MTWNGPIYQVVSGEVVLSTRNASLFRHCVLFVHRMCVWRINFVHTVFVCECCSACVCFERVLCSALRVLSLIRNKQPKPVSHSRSRHLARREIARASRAFQLSLLATVEIVSPNAQQYLKPLNPRILASQQPRSQDMSETLTNSNAQNTYLSLSSKAIVSSHNLWSTASAHITHFTPIECDSLINNNNCSSAVTQCMWWKEKNGRRGFNILQSIYTSRRERNRCYCWIYIKALVKMRNGCNKSKLIWIFIAYKSFDGIKFKDCSNFLCVLNLPEWPR